MNHYSIVIVVRASLLSLLVLAASGTAALRADVTSDLAFTAFHNPDLHALGRGQVLQARGGLIDFQRGITTQSLYVINAPPSEVQSKLISWNPATHSELKVWMHQSLPAHPTLADFGGLQSLPNNSSVQYLINSTEKLDPNNPSLQMDSSEAQLISSMRTQGMDPRTLVTTAWSQILSGRVDRFLSGNLSSGTYLVSGGDISPMSEIKSLLRSDVMVYQRVHPLLAQTPLYNSTKMTPVDLYYESFDVEGGAALGTGAVYQSQTPKAASVNGMVAENDVPVMSADIEYFLNYGIYVSVELEQISPVTIDGRQETLVWRDDLVSTSNIAYLHGTERLASGMIMLQDVKQAIDAFRSEFR